ncbi:hypothetical protein Cni_G02157 [Canna indica]|uniref:Uncharacterized protein n=1 Tax=Canna indica TaxID=4628 RepID=A0AAQ3Q203_9LILI|nr:hypothetical protein Cni_G02157 [Canna indica]
MTPSSTLNVAIASPHRWSPHPLLVVEASRLAEGFPPAKVEGPAVLPLPEEVDGLPLPLLLSLPLPLVDDHVVNGPAVDGTIVD